MSASSSLSRLEFVLNHAEAQQQAGTAATNGSHGSNGAGSAISKILPSWMGGKSNGSSKGTLPSPAGSSTASASASSSAQAMASSAAASATAAAHKVGHSASEFFSLVSSKVTGKEHVPSAPPVESRGDIEEGNALLASSDPGGASSGLVAQFSSEFHALTTLSWRQRMVAFAGCSVAGVAMLALSFGYVPMIFLGSSAKFALSYALGNIFLLAASCFLVGPAKQLSQMFGEQRALVSGVYLSSLFLLFYVSWAWRSFFVVIPVLVIQLASLLCYVMSYVPFGQGMLRRICSWTFGLQLNF